jgi:Rrf2 family protein
MVPHQPADVELFFQADWDEFQSCFHPGITGIIFFLPKNRSFLVYNYHKILSERSYFIHDLHHLPSTALHNKIVIVDRNYLFLTEEAIMQITRQADYAVRAVLHLARSGDQRIATNMIAEEQRIPPSFLAKIVSQLSIAGLLHTSRGARGGVTLARDPKEISLLEVIEAIDGPIQLNECVGENSTCSFDDNCPLRPVWCEAHEQLVSRLKGTNFAEMMRKETFSG